MRRDFPVDDMAEAAAGLPEYQPGIAALVEADEEGLLGDSGPGNVAYTQFAGVWRRTSWHASALLEAALWVLRVFVLLMAFAFALALGLLVGEPRLKPMLAWCAVALQAGMLALFFPAVLILAVKLSPEFTDPAVRSDMLVRGGWVLAWHAGLGVLVALAGGATYLLRPRWNPVARLIMAWPLQAAIAAGFALGALPLFFRAFRPAGILEETGTALLLLLFVASSAVALARFALHISTDIVNHFTPPDRGGSSKRIVQRLLTILDRLAQEERPQRVLIVAHSQGTVYAYDMLCLALPLAFKGVAVSLVTMGSPIDHLYCFYFPRQYDLEREGGILRGTVSCWLNLHHIDDYVGTTIGGCDSKLVPGHGHLGYWVQAEAMKHVLAVIDAQAESSRSPGPAAG